MGSHVTWVKPPQIHGVEDRDECKWREGNCWLCPGASQSCLVVRGGRRDAPQALLSGRLVCHACCLLRSHFRHH